MSWRNSPRDGSTSTIKTHFGTRIFSFAGEAYEPFIAQLWILLAMWLFLYWLYRQRVFIRI